MYAAPPFLRLELILGCLHASTAVFVSTHQGTAERGGQVAAQT